MNPHVETVKKELEQINQMSFKQFQKLRNKRFRIMLLHQYENPYNDSYKKLLNEYGIKDKSELPKNINELRKLPIVDKKFLNKADYNTKPALHEIEIYKRLETSGTTGKPLVIPHSNKFAIENMCKLIIRAQIMNYFSLEKNGYFIPHYLPGKNENFSSYESLHLMRSLLGQDKVMLESTQTPHKSHFNNLVKLGAVYSSSSPNFYISLLSSFLSKKYDLKKIKLKEILCGGAGLSKKDFEFIKAKIKLDKLLLFYPTTDAGVIGTQIYENSNYVVFSDHILVEVLDKNGNQVKEGEKGEIYVTNLLSDTYPIIRYRLGDEVTFRGRSKYYDKFVEISDVKRLNFATFGDGLISFDELEEIPGYCRKQGVMAYAIQLIKRKHKRLDQAILRVECQIKKNQTSKAKEVIVSAFRKNEEMDFLLKDESIAYPKVELLKQGELTKGKFKSKIFLDES